MGLGGGGYAAGNLSPQRQVPSPLPGSSVGGCASPAVSDNRSPAAKPVSRRSDPSLGRSDRFSQPTAPTGSQPLPVSPPNSAPLGDQSQTLSDRHAPELALPTA